MSFSSNKSKYFILFSSKKHCTYCEYAKALLESMPYEFVECIVDFDDSAARAEFVGMLKSYFSLMEENRIKIPQIFCISEDEYSTLKQYPTLQSISYISANTNRKYVGGFDGLVKFVHEGRS